MPSKCPRKVSFDVAFYSLFMKRMALQECKAIAYGYSFSFTIDECGIGRSPRYHRDIPHKSVTLSRRDLLSESLQWDAGSVSHIHHGGSHPHRLSYGRFVFFAASFSSVGEVRRRRGEGGRVDPSRPRFSVPASLFPCPSPGSS